MAPAASEVRSDFFVRALAVVGTNGVLHFGVAHVLLTLLLAGGPPGVPHGREVVSLSVLVTLLIVLATLYVRSQYGDPPDVVRSVPAAMRAVPPVATVLLALLVLPPRVLEIPLLDVAVAIAPTFAAVWAGAIIVSLPVRQVLHALAIRRPAPGRTPKTTPTTPPLVEQTVREVLVGASCAVALLVLSTAAHRLGGSTPLDATMLLPGVGLLVFPLLAALCGTTLGQTPAGDILSVARRLDQPTQSDQDMAPPIVATRWDEVGELLTNLEALRGRLGKDLHRYESVLEQAQTAERIKADFLNAVSHELRTPLNVVGGFTQLLLEGHPVPLTDPQAEDVRLIRAGGKQLLDLINDILDISMIESGDLRLHFSRTELGPLVREAVDFHQPQLRDKPVVLRAEVSPELRAPICDRRRIGQILNNLVSNAIKFTEEGQIVVRVAFDAHADAVMLRCIDTGVGIAAEELDDIFEEYRQAGSNTRRKKGTGLGLAIARSIAEHHGGHLTADSVVGKGSTFTLTLPIEPPTRPASIDMAEEVARSVVRRTFLPGELRPSTDPRR